MAPVCPKCDVPLFIVRFRAVEADYCDACRGLWLDTGEMEAILHDAGVEPDGSLERALAQPGVGPSAAQLCPRCDQPLHEIRLAAAGQEPLVLDCCPRQHGLWFDAGELPRLFQLTAPAPAAAAVVAYLNDVLGTNLTSAKGEPKS